MTNKTVNLTIVTPKGIVLEKNITFAKLPGKIGEIGILYNHSSILAELKAGKIRITDDNNQTEKFFISQGFIQFVKDNLTINVPYLENAESIDIDRAKEAKERAEHRMKSEPENQEFDNNRNKNALERALTRIEIYNAHHKIKD